MHPFGNNQIQPPQLVSQKKDTSPEEVLQHDLFERRSAILWNLANRGSTSNNIYTEKLQQIDQELKALGVSPLDYEDYMNKKRAKLH